MAVKILSVDDENDLELLLTQYFRRKIRKGEYEFFFAHNGIEALRVLLEQPDINIILSDINMPEMDGLTLLAMHHGVSIWRYGQYTYGDEQWCFRLCHETY